MEIFADTNIGKVRKNNEDTCLVRELPDGNALLLVADGMGGMVRGGLAAKIVRDYFSTVELPEKPDAAELVKQAHLCLLDEIRKDITLRDTGTTAVCAWIVDDKMYWGNSGDSRLYLWRDNYLQQITTDHNNAQIGVNSGVFTVEEARVHPSSGVLNNYLGDYFCSPDGGLITLKEKDLILLCSDGLHGEIQAEVLSTLMDTPSDVGLKGEVLIKTALDAGGADNVTVILAEI